MYIVLSLAIASIVTLIARKLLASRRSTTNVPYPPGPKPMPVVGNLFDFPSPGADAAQVYVQGEKRYNSGILHASALGNHVVILNKREDAEELLERRSAKYSDRPWSALIPMMGWERNIAFVPYGNELKELRKVCQKNLGKESAHTYNPIQTMKVLEMLQALINTPEKYNDHIKLFAVSVPMAMMYGYEVNSTNDPCIAAADRSASLGAQVLAPGGSMINVLPFLRHVPAWFPGASSHKIAAEVSRLTDEMIRIPTELIKRRLREKTLVPASLVSDFLEKKETLGASAKEEALVTNAAYSIYLVWLGPTQEAFSVFYYP